MPDLRLFGLGLVAWGAALVAGAGWPWLLLLAVAVSVGLRRPSLRVTVAAALLVVVGVGAATAFRAEQRSTNPVAQLASAHAVAAGELEITSDPRVRAGRSGDFVLVRGRVVSVTGRGLGWTLAAPVLVIGDSTWSDVRLGQRVVTSGRLAPGDGDVSAVWSVRAAPRTVAEPGPWWVAAGAVRAALRASVAGRPADQAALVPALVVGDDAQVGDDLGDDFRTTGLTHLLAVSGTNLTLVVGFLLILCRWAGVRGRWLHLVGLLGIVGFVLLARTEPSVVRAAAMGTVALIGMTHNGLQRGVRALGAAVLVLLLFDPSLGRSAGFALSVLATGAILLLAPPWRDALMRWLPRPVAEAVSVPAAAQLACTPLVAALSGQVSLVAVAANLLAAPAVGPATVLGLLAGLVGLVAAPLGSALGWLAAWCVAWIIEVAHVGAGLPHAALEWGTGPLSLTLLVALCVGIVLVAPGLLRRRATGLGCCALLVVVILVRPPTPGWPPEGWILAACDVGQGDGLVLRAGDHAGIVIDAGPEAGAIDRCLTSLDIDRVPLLALTHFHADHVDGLAGVLDGRTVDRIEVTPLADPPESVAAVRRAAAAAGLEPLVAPYATRVIGDVTLQLVWPPPGVATVGPGDGSTANDSSLVFLAEVRGVRILLSGDIEPPSQARVARSLVGLRVDVLKVPHHGSRHQDLDFLLSLGARVALVSAGEDNDYGHPSMDTLRPLAATGARVLRTDLDGDVLVIVDDGVLRTVTRD